ncbi:MAG: aminotransferase class V-fold PLP-dependent enzyme, partial [Sphingomonadales bacterium]
MDFPISAVRGQFAALSDVRVYLDGPGGTQICRQAVDRMVAHLVSGTANAGGPFRTSIETDALSAEAHQAMADLLGGTADEIAFGQNMTSLTFAVSRALAAEWQAGDEIVLTRLDHDANVSPWLRAAEDRGVTVRWLDFHPESGRWMLDELAGLLGPRTRLVALGIASNALGTVNPVTEAIRIVRQHSSALVYLDAVQSVP